MFFIKRKRYFVGRAVVTPLDDKEKGIFGFGNKVTKAALEETLKNELNLPLYDSTQTYNKTDIGIDIVVSDYSYGFSATINLGEYGGFYWFNRPKVKIVARTFKAMDYSTINEFTIIQRMAWLKFIKRTISLKRLLSFRFIFDDSDMQVVLAAACIRLLKYIKSSNS